MTGAGGMGESIAQFMERQRRKVARFTREAEAAAHEAYGTAIRASEELKLSSPSEVMRHGAELLQESRSRVSGTVSKAAEHAKRSVANTIDRVGKTPVLRSAVVGAAGSAGTLAGVARGGVHAVEGLADGAVFLSRLGNPYDPYVSPPGHSARDQLANAGREAAKYAKAAVADPQMVVDDLAAKVHQMRIDLDPSATPAAPTFAGELQRSFEIGQNQGELAFNLGAAVVGGPAASTVKGYRGVSNIGNVEKYVAQGFSPEAAAHLAKPYPRRGMGHHFIGRRYGLPETYSDSVFNVLKPEDISIGDFNELHYKVDPMYYGGAVIRGEGWSGKKLGFERYGLAGQLWHGSPPPLKARVGGLGAASGAVMYAPEEAGQP